MNAVSIDLRAIVGLLARQFRVIIAIVLVITAAAAAAIFTMPPTYTATALLQVDPSGKNLLEPDAPSSPLGDSARIDGDVEILRSDHILLTLLNRDPTILAPAEPAAIVRIAIALGFLSPGPDAPSDDTAERLAALRSAVSIQRRGNTYLIAITARSTQPATAAQLTNALADTFVADQLTAKIAATLRARDILEARVAEARTEIASFETRLDQFIDEHFTAIAAVPGTGDFTRLRTQITQLLDIRNSTTASLEAATLAIQHEDWPATMAALKSTSLPGLYQQRAAINPPSPVSATDPPAALETELSRLDAEMRATAEREMAALRQTIELTDSRAAALRQDLRRQLLDYALPPTIVAGLYELQQDAELARQQHLTLLQRVATVETQASLQLADSRIVSPALEPRLPAPPGRLLLLALAFCTALIAAAAIAFLYENYLGGFTSAAQLESVLKLKVAAAIPQHKQPTGASGPADLVVLTPKSDYADAIRKLRTYIFQLARPRPRDPTSATTILLTSSEPHEGTSTTALALARAYALSASSVVLIDCHLRQPRLHQLSGTTTRANLQTYLSGTLDTDLLAITANDSHTPAALILAEDRDVDLSGQLLIGQRFDSLLRAAQSTYDVVILDTPSLASAADSLYLAPHVDTVVFVVRSATTTQQDARRALTELIDVIRPDTRILAVLNQQAGSAVPRSRRERARSVA